MELEETCEISVNIENITKKDGIYRVMIGVDKSFQPPHTKYFELDEKYLIGNKLKTLAPCTQIIVKSKRPLSLNEDAGIIQVYLGNELIYDAGKSEAEKEDQKMKILQSRIKRTQEEFEFH